MREIQKTISVSMEGKTADVRLTKLDIAELIRIRRENERRAAEAARGQIVYLPGFLSTAISIIFHGSALTIFLSANPTF